MAAFDGGGEPRTTAQAKRKYAISDSHDPNPKKPRVADLHPPASHPSNHLQSQSQSLEPYRPLLDRLKPRYEVKHMSVMPSTKTSSHITKALEHLSRFSVWDQSVLPGVILLTAKSVASSKLITISEVVRRRIGESEQKWYQYNVLNETTGDSQQPLQRQHQAAAMMNRSVVEDTYMLTGGHQESNAEDGGADDQDNYFETSAAAAPTVYEQAVHPLITKPKPLLAVFFSRVPLEELKILPNIGAQTNEEHIEYLRKRKMGLVG